MHFLPTVVYTLPMELERRMCFTIKSIKTNVLLLWFCQRTQFVL